MRTKIVIFQRPYFSNLLILSYLGCSIACLAEPPADLTLTKPSIDLTLYEAIQKNLLQQPEIRIFLENINIQEGIAQSSAAPFDPAINGEAKSIYSKDLLSIGQNTNDIFDISPSPICSARHTDLKAHEAIYHFDVEKKIREGTVFTFSMDIDQVNNPLNCPRKLNTGKLAVGIDQPLLQNLGDGLERMTEVSNILEISAVRFDTLQSISQQVLNTTLIYWNTLAARKIYEAQLASEERLKALVEKVRYIIEHKQLAESEIVQPLAQLSAQIVNRMAAEQTYYASLQQLKLAIGEWNEECPCPNDPFEPVDDFPFIEIDLNSITTIFCGLFPRVYQQRFDILASTKREEVFGSLLRGAKNFELPRLDVVGRVNLTNAKSGNKSKETFTSIDLNHSQVDMTIGVVLSTTLYRDESRGLIRQRQAQLSQTMAQTQLLKQQALTDINAALRNQWALQQEVKKAKDAADEYDLLLKNETTKLLAGYSTLFILLNYESSLTAAIIQYIQLQDLFAQNIVQLRFLTGTLLRYSPWTGKQSFIVEDAKKLPFDGCKI